MSAVSPTASPATGLLEDQVALRVSKIRSDAHKQHADQLLEMMAHTMQILGQPMGPILPGLGENINILA